jgi:uridine kinase
MKIVSSIDEWCYDNLYLIEECFEKFKKVIVLTSGASSSGKSYSNKILFDFLKEKGYKCLCFSTDSYNIGISGILTRKVNEKYYDNKLDINNIQKIIKDTIISSNFDDKFNSQNLLKIKSGLLNNNLVSKTEIDSFLNHIVNEFKQINFDEPSVYDLPCVANDLKNLCDNKSITIKKYSKLISERDYGDIISGLDYNIILVEGIFALNNNLLSELDKDDIITNFVSCDSKTMFLRRILRDSKITSASNYFTIKSYFENVMPAYFNYILPTKNNADLVLNNNMSFVELREGEIYSNQIKVKLNNKILLNELIRKSLPIAPFYEKDIYFKSDEENFELNNLLRARLIGKDKNSYILSSLVHKGDPFFRKDSKMIRPINILVKDGELKELYKNEDELIKIFKSGNLFVGRIIEKKRFYLNIDDEKITCDEMEDGSVFLEINQSKLTRIDNQILNNGVVCNSNYGYETIKN